jgi:hypothetical protein
MIELITVYPICLFDIIHSSRLAEGNFLAWALGVSAGLISSGYLASRSRGR